MAEFAKEAEGIFLAALDKATPRERSDYVEGACAGKPELLRRVRELLASHEQSLGPLDIAPNGVNRTALDMSAISERPGTVIGPYKLMEQIGEGGMGLVFVAAQHKPVRRKVAIKVIKPGMDTRDVIARFEAERQALALMDHQNIAKVLDAGATESGRPYFVMELVRGVPITDYCDDNQLTPRDRLALFVDVCQAVQHAHTKGIIHRDLKPSNVLIAPHDGKPVVKIIDFGVAKAVGQQLTDKTIYTCFSQMIGTPLYMSPEQAQLNALDIDTRSDVYGLGVLLYELLTGTTPFERQRLHKAAFDEIRRIIREEEPPKPSTRLSTMGATLSATSAARKMEPKKLSALVKGDLDWIVMKALEKDRTRRYETANAFARDIEHYLHDQPVDATPPSACYRARKFAKRNKRGLAIAAMIGFFAVLVGSGVGWELMDRGSRREIADERANGVLREVDLLQKQEKWPEAVAVAQRLETTLGSDVSARMRTQISARVADLKVASKLDEIRLSYSVNVSARKVDIEFADAFRKLGIEVLELPAEEAGGLLRKHSINAELAAALDDWALMRRTTREMKDANWQHLLAVALVAQPDDGWRNRWRVAMQAHDCRKAMEELADSAPVNKLPPRTLALLGRSLSALGALEHSIRFLRQAHLYHPDDFWINLSIVHCLIGNVSFRIEAAGSFSGAAFALRPDSLGAQFNYAYHLAMTKEPDAAIAALNEFITRKSDYAPFYNALLIAYYKKGDLEKAITAGTEAVRLNDKYYGAYFNLGEVLNKANRFDEALIAYQHAALDRMNPRSNFHLGKLLKNLGRNEEALAAILNGIADHEALPTQMQLDNSWKKDYLEAKRNIALLENSLGLRPKDAPIPTKGVPKLNEATAHYSRGVKHLADGELDDAIKALREAIKVKPDYASAYANLGVALRRSDKAADAIVQYKAALGFKSANPTQIHTNIGSALVDLGRFEEAIAEFNTALRLSPSYFPARCLLGHASAANGQQKQAIDNYHQGIKLKPTAKDLEFLTTTMTLGKGGNSIDYFFLALAHFQLGDKEQARTWYDKGVVWMVFNRPNDADLQRFRTEAAELLGIKGPAKASNRLFDPKPFLRSSL